MVLRRPQPRQAGYLHIVGPEHPDLEHIGFGLLSLADGESWTNTFSGFESVLVILGGRCDIEADGRNWESIGDRADVFDGKPTAVYCPPGCTCHITGRGGVMIAVCSAKADSGPDPTLISPDQIGLRLVGTDNFERRIHDIVSLDNLPARSLIVGETYNLPGMWSSYPPHKHDTHNPPQESHLEEVYYFRLRPPQGFGFQRVYGSGSDQAYAVQDGDVVTISKGYHPVAAAPGYELYYLWILAGEHRVVHMCEDPNHSWVLRDLKRGAYAGST
jgi:5-deoxy-glucuronate isomerase